MQMEIPISITPNYELKSTVQVSSAIIERHYPLTPLSNHYIHCWVYLP